MSLLETCCLIQCNVIGLTGKKPDWHKNLCCRVICFRRLKLGEIFEATYSGTDEWLRTEMQLVGSVCTSILRPVRTHRRPISTGWTAAPPRSADGRQASRTTPIPSASAWRQMVNFRTQTVGEIESSCARDLQVSPPIESFVLTTGQPAYFNYLHVKPWLHVRHQRYALYKFMFYLLTYLHKKFPNINFVLNIFAKVSTVANIKQ